MLILLRSRALAACSRASFSHVQPKLPLVQRYATSSRFDVDYDHDQDQSDFSDMAGELRRRKRKADAKRRQYGNTFVDHVLVTVRGGKGGSGASALAASLRGPSSPCGGNGGPGGSIYLTTSPHLTSLATLKKRVIGGQGASGSGAFRHGRRGGDVLITVPVGTIVRELKREGEEERTVREEDDLGLDETEKRKRKWGRWFIIHPSAGGEVSINEYQEAEALLKREGRWINTVPSFEESPPIALDLETPIPANRPILLAQGGQGGFGNPFFPSPRVASRGTLPATQTFEFELKLLADVGLVGFPNSGKSTLLRALTGRKAEVANYAFTTLNPQIGVVRVWEDGGWAGALESGESVQESWREREDDEIARLLGEELPSMSVKRHTGKVTSNRDLEVNDGVAGSESGALGEGAEEAFSTEDGSDAVDGPSQTQTQSQIQSQGENQSETQSLGVNLGKGKGRVEKIRFTLSDNPGLLPLASQNVGLGHSFLRSIERSPVLVYVLDLTRSDPASDLLVLRTELEEYKAGLSGRAGIVVLNKADQVDEAQGKDRVQAVKQALGEKGEVVVLSGKFGLGVKGLVELLAGKVEQARREMNEETEQKERLALEPRLGPQMSGSESGSESENERTRQHAQPPVQEQAHRERERQQRSQEVSSESGRKREPGSVSGFGLKRS